MEVLQDTYKEVVLGTRFLKLNIPNHWSKSILGKYTTESISYGVVTAIEVESSEGISMIRSGGLDSEKGIIKNVKFIDKLNESNHKKTRLIGGEILIALVGATIGLIGIAPSFCKGYNVSRAVAVVRLTSNCNSHFIMYLLRSSFIQKKINVMTSGSAQPVINLEQLRKLPLIIPPLPEQQKIAHILSTVDEQISTTNKIIERSKELKKGLIQKLFSEGIGHTEFKDTKIGRIPKDWEVVKIRDINEDSLLGGNYKNGEGEKGIPLIKMGNLDRGKIKLNKIVNIPETLVYDNKHILKEGDFLFNTRNTLELVGKVAIWRNELKKALYNSNLLKIDFNKSKVHSTKFMNYVFNSDLVIKKLRGLATGSTSVAAIYNKDLFKLKVPLPPLLEQQKIAAILLEADAKIEKEQTQKAHLEALKKGLMQQLLTGKKRVKV
ncbi:restriction endonuclease subunit S [Flavobacteriaceae bacterium]|nr:restriction endonuclease subunit S [Flavobacteriaceae bacterium]